MEKHHLNGVVLVVLVWSWDIPPISHPHLFIPEHFEPSSSQKGCEMLFFSALQQKIYLK